MSDGVLISEALEGLGATYCSILSFDKDNNLIYKKSSNPEWAEEFASHTFLMLENGVLLRPLFSYRQVK